MPRQHSHCTYCGNPYDDSLAWPRACEKCGETTWRNPTPVALALVPIVMENGPTGLLMVRRGIPPQIGELGLPGGFIEEGESWQQATVRELHEETGLVADVDEVVHVSTLSAPAHVILVFGQVRPRSIADLASLTPAVVHALSDGEVTELVVVDKPRTLAFPLHTIVAEQFFTKPGA